MSDVCRLFLQISMEAYTRGRATTDSAPVPPSPTKKPTTLRRAGFVSSLTSILTGRSTGSNDDAKSARVGNMAANRMVSYQSKQGSSMKSPSQQQRFQLPFAHEAACVMDMHLLAITLTQGCTVSMWVYAKCNTSKQVCVCVVPSLSLAIGLKRELSEKQAKKESLKG
jgi:hypothetical protein